MTLSCVALVTTLTHWMSRFGSFGPGCPVPVPVPSLDPSWIRWHVGFFGFGFGFFLVVAWACVTPRNSGTIAASAISFVVFIGAILCWVTGLGPVLGRACGHAWRGRPGRTAGRDARST